MNKSEIKLRSTHLWDPEPKEEEFPFSEEKPDGNILGYLDEEEYQKVHSEWKRRQVKPDVKVMTYTDNNVMTYRSNLQHDFESDEEAIKALDYYNQHRRRWEGFEKSKHMAYKRYTGLYIPGNVCEVTFDTESTMVVVTCDHFECHFRNGLSVSLFEQICQENGIILKPIES